MNTMASTLRKDAGGVQVLTSQAQAIISILTMWKKNDDGKASLYYSPHVEKSVNALKDSISVQEQCQNRRQNI